MFIKIMFSTTSIYKSLCKSYCLLHALILKPDSYFNLDMMQQCNCFKSQLHQSRDFFRVLNTGPWDWDFFFLFLSQKIFLVKKKKKKNCLVVFTAFFNFDKFRSFSEYAKCFVFTL